MTKTRVRGKAFQVRRRIRLRSVASAPQLQVERV